MEESRIDFAIITAIEVERRAVCQAFGMGDEDRDRESARTYWKTQLDLGNRQFYELVVTQLPDAASVDAALAVAADDQIHHYRREQHEGRYSPHPGLAPDSGAHQEPRGAGL